MPSVAYAPDLKPVDRPWLHSRECFFSPRVFDSYGETVPAGYPAWNSLTRRRPQSSRSSC